MSQPWLRRLATHVQRRAEWYWAPALYAAAVALLYRTLWAGEAGFGWDTIETYWSDLAFLSGQLARGEWPLWNPYDRGGYPFFADPQPAMYYPVRWLFAAVGAVAGETSWWHIQLVMLLHHVIAAAGLHGFLRTRGLPAVAALAGALALVVSAPFMLHKASNILHPLAWTPLIWIAIDRLSTRPGARTACLLAGSLYLAGSAGSPPGLFYTLLMAVGYGAFRTLGAVVAAGRAGRVALWSFARRYALALGLAFAVTLGLLLVIVLPGMELTALSPRAERSMAYALQGGLEPGAVLRGLVQPDLGAGEVYAGAVVALLAACALLLAPRRDGGAPLYLATAAAVCLCLCLSGRGLLLPWLVEHVPGFGLFRIASRYKLPFALAYAALAGYGAAALLEAPRARRDRVLALVVAGVVAALVALVVLAHDGSAPPAARPAWHSLALIAVAAALAVAANWTRRRIAAALVALLALLVFADVPHFLLVHGEALEARPERRPERWLAGLEGVGNDWRLYDEFVIEQRAGSRLRVRELRSYPSGDPLDTVRYRELLRAVADHPALLEELNVRYVLHGPHHRNGLRANALARAPSSLAPGHFRGIDRQLDEVLHPAPLVSWYGGAQLAADADDALARVARGHELDGTRRRAVIEPADAARLEPALLAALTTPADPPAAVAGHLARYDVDEIRVRVDAPARGLVVLNEASYPGWQVSVDGHERAPLTANYLLRAVAVDAGHHTIVWRFEPRSYGWLVAAWALGWLALLLALVVPRH